MNNTTVIDLTGDNAINIGSSYETNFQLCDAPDITDATGLCHVRSSVNDVNIIISPIVEILTKDLFRIKVNYDAYPSEIVAGNYIYDVLLILTNNLRFYPVGGRCQLIKRVSRVTV